MKRAMFVARVRERTEASQVNEVKSIAFSRTIDLTSACSRPSTRLRPFAATRSCSGGGGLGGGAEASEVLPSSSSDLPRKVAPSDGVRSRSPSDGVRSRMASPRQAVERKDPVQASFETDGAARDEMGDAGAVDGAGAGSAPTQQVAESGVILPAPVPADPATIPSTLTTQAEIDDLLHAAEAMRVGVESESAADRPRAASLDPDQMNPQTPQDAPPPPSYDPVASFNPAVGSAESTSAELSSDYSCVRIPRMNRLAGARP